MSGTIIINNQPVAFDKEKSLLEVITNAGIDLHTLCYNKQLAPFGACRMCIVENEKGMLMTACTTAPADGMNIKTHTPRVNRIRKMALELVLGNHPSECQTCDKSGHCRLQDAANAYGVDKIRFKKPEKDPKVDNLGPSLIRDNNKCVLCGNCVRVCEEIQGVKAINFAGRGSNSKIACAFDVPLSESTCINCGQCLAVCPTGAITPLDQTWKVKEAIADENKLVVFQFAPSVRAALTEEYGIENAPKAMAKATTALKMMGVDYVFDTNWSADLTIWEEATEFLGRVAKGERLPLFTSCCPAWIKYCEEFYPEFLNNLSTCKSPQGMLSAYVKKYLADDLNLDLGDKKIFMVSVMPCTAKKYEASRKQLVTKDGEPETDVVLTSQEIIKLFREYGFNLADLAETPMDNPLSQHTGGGVIFGVSGGVAEAVVRYAFNDGAVVEACRGTQELKEIDLDYKGIPVKVAIVNGMDNAGKLLDAIKSGEKEYTIIEVMCCRGGCIGGGGQPVPNEMAQRELRKDTIYDADYLAALKNPADNPDVKAIYERHLGEPNSHAAHEILHTSYEPRDKVTGQWSKD
ncbi:MAG: [FeFe] hydrogenase, group A [Abditibacteriota bacterium]|nr:[FeFe] hydrogenase, group A [Abditibacteriota bacterium]